ncbi:MAG: hypothetical protein GY791_10780 [Alphaproteobacteria bacterium]|nr:hypothetical protein [Alphaproteobacteria bacterium]
MYRLIALACAFAFFSIGPAASQSMVTQAVAYDDFRNKFCAASRDFAHIFIVPIAVFDDYKSVTCSDGESTLRVSEPADDPGHKVYNIDPPHGAKKGLDCDSKADIGMTFIAINCIPADFESAGHKKS